MELLSSSASGFDSRTLALLSRLATRKRESLPSPTAAGQNYDVVPAGRGGAVRPQSAVVKDSSPFPLGGLGGSGGGGQGGRGGDDERGIGGGGGGQRATSSYGKRPSTSDTSSRNPRLGRSSTSVQPRTFEFVTNGAQLTASNSPNLHGRFVGGGGGGGGGGGSLVSGRPGTAGAGIGGGGGRRGAFGTSPQYSQEETNGDWERSGGGVGGGGGSNKAWSGSSSGGVAAAAAGGGTAEEGKHEERILFAESTTNPGVVMCYRSKEEKAASPERLNLDRRKMTMCPLLEGEERLRLLNYQHNYITKIDNLHNLPNLIFLDLYNNQIKSIQNLEHLTTLRVLMLGKNSLSKIENMHSLTRLDVLDLHSNAIAKIENLERLVELRVLNLAGNAISVVEGLDSLLFLTELNLRRNQVSKLKSIDALPCLQRLFLSNNNLKTFDSLDTLFKSRSLAELALDANPVASEQHYRHIVIDSIRTLRHLDLKRVSEEDRRHASQVAKKELEKVSEESRREQANGERLLSIQKVQSEWENSSVNSSSINTINNNAASASSLSNNNNANSGNNGDVSPSLSSVGAPATSSPRALSLTASATQQNASNNVNNNTNSSSNSSNNNNYSNAFGSGGNAASGYAEIVGEKENVAHIYGKALDVLERSSNLTTVVIKFVAFRKIVEGFAKLKNLPLLVSLTISNSDMGGVGDVAQLVALTQLQSLSIVENPVSLSPLLRPFVAFRLPHIVELNGQRISRDERERGAAMFANYSKVVGDLLAKGDVMANVALLSLQDMHCPVPPVPGVVVPALPLPAASRDLNKIESFAAAYTEGLIDQAVWMGNRLNTLHAVWNDVLMQCVSSALLPPNYDEQ